MKINHFFLVCVLVAAAFCAAQTAPAARNSDANQSAQPPEPPPPPAKASTGQSAQTPEQTQTQPKSKDSAKGATNDASGASAGTSAGTSKDRLFYALPNFLTLEGAGDVKPLTAGEKFKVVTRASFDPVQAVWYGFLSGISQAEDSEPGYGQGAEGYGKRYGAYAADGTIENFFVGAIFPSMLHQDPRYFQSGKGSFLHRTGYSVSRIFVTRTDSGNSQFNYSEIVGSALASAISTYSYHPHTGYHPKQGVMVEYTASDRTLKNTASVWGSQVGYDTITLVVKEFWPDIRRKLKKQPH